MAFDPSNNDNRNSISNSINCSNSMSSNNSNNSQNKPMPQQGQVSQQNGQDGTGKGDEDILTMDDMQNYDKLLKVLNTGVTGIASWENWYPVKMAGTLIRAKLIGGDYSMVIFNKSILGVATMGLENTDAAITIPQVYKSFGPQRWAGKGMYINMAETCHFWENLCNYNSSYGHICMGGTYTNWNECSFVLAAFMSTGDTNGLMDLVEQVRERFGQRGCTLKQVILASNGHSRAESRDLQVSVLGEDWDQKEGESPQDYALRKKGWENMVSRTFLQDMNVLRSMFVREYNISMIVIERAHQDPSAASRPDNEGIPFLKRIGKRVAGRMKTFKSCDNFIYINGPTNSSICTRVLKIGSASAPVLDDKDQLEYANVWNGFEYLMYKRDRLYGSNGIIKRSVWPSSGIRGNAKKASKYLSGFVNTLGDIRLKYDKDDNPIFDESGEFIKTISTTAANIRKQMNGFLQVHRRGHNLIHLIGANNPNIPSKWSQVTKSLLIKKGHNQYRVAVARANEESKNNTNPAARIGALSSGARILRQRDRLLNNTMGSQKVTNRKSSNKNTPKNGNSRYVISTPTSNVFDRRSGSARFPFGTGTGIAGGSGGSSLSTVIGNNSNNGNSGRRKFPFKRTSKKGKKMNKLDRIRIGGASGTGKGKKETEKINNDITMDGYDGDNEEASNVNGNNSNNSSNSSNYDNGNYHNNNYGVNSGNNCNNTDEVTDINEEREVFLDLVESYSFNDIKVNNNKTKEKKSETKTKSKSD